MRKRKNEAANQPESKSPKRRTKRVGLFGSLQIMCMSAMLTAMSVVIGILCKNFLNFGGGLFRITFENLPIIMSGIMFGPVVGGAVGAATDIVSYFMSGQIYPLNPIVTAGAAAVGLVSGVFAKYVFRKRGYARIVFSALAAHLAGSLIIKPIGLFVYYGIAVLWRIPAYMIIAPLEILIMCAMYRNRGIKRFFDGAAFGGRHEL